MLHQRDRRRSCHPAPMALAPALRGARRHRGPWDHHAPAAIAHARSGDRSPRPCSDGSTLATRRQADRFGNPSPLALAPARRGERRHWGPLDNPTPPAIAQACGGDRRPRPNSDGSNPATRRRPDRFKFGNPETRTRSRPTRRVAPLGPLGPPRPLGDRSRTTR